MLGDDVTDFRSFLIPLPDFGYSGTDSTSDDSYAYLGLERKDLEITVQTANATSTDTPLGLNVSNFHLLSFSSLTGTLPSMNSFWLKAGWLSSDFSMIQRNDGLAFKMYDPEAYDDYGDLHAFSDSARLMGEFYIGSDPYTRYDVDTEDWGGSYLSYYQVLYYSDFPFLDYLPREYDRDQWIRDFNSVDNVDFEDPSVEDIELLKNTFEWVGPIFGTFQIHFTDMSVGILPLPIQYILTDRIVINRVFETMLEDSAYSGYTGFEKVTHFLGSAVQGFFSVEILPDFSLGSILVVIIAFSLVLWWLKVFAGG